MSTPVNPSPDMARRNRRVVLTCLGVVGGMTGLAFASVPLYDLFCRVTGFGGTPMVRASNDSRLSDRSITIRFDANVAPGLGWTFTPETPTVTARLGETKTVSYKITNTSDKTTTGIASFNVAPATTGAYFMKIQCFCFTEHTLKPGESLEAPVVFYIDPDLDKVAELKGTRAITLSYTYFPARGSQPLAEVRGEGDKPKL